MTRIRIIQRCTRGRCPHTGFVGSLFLISPRTGHVSSQVFGMLPACSCISLVKKTLHRHPAGFERQRESPFLKRVKTSHILGVAFRACTMIPLFVLPFTLLVVLRSLHCADHHPIRIEDERERLVTASR
jgi:hypothetical protein